MFTHTHPPTPSKKTHTYTQAEFDYLKSLEIEEKINGLRWATPINSACQAY